MYEYEVVRYFPLDSTIVWGSSYEQAMRKAGLNPDEWHCVFYEKVED